MLRMGLLYILIGYMVQQHHAFNVIPWGFQGWMVFRVWVFKSLEEMPLSFSVAKLVLVGSFFWGGKSVLAVNLRFTCTLGTMGKRIRQLRQFMQL